MCQKCVDALHKYYPQVKEEDTGDFLMCVTCFPFGSGEQVARMLKETKEATDGSIEAAYEYADKAMGIAMSLSPWEEIEGKCPKCSAEKVHYRDLGPDEPADTDQYWRSGRRHAWKNEGKT